MQNNENEIIGVTAFARDISERILADKMLIAERDRKRMCFRPQER